MLEKALVDSIGAFFGMIKVYAKKVFNRLIIEEIMKTLRFTSWVILLFLFSSVVTFTQSDNQLFTIEETSYLEANNHSWPRSIKWNGLFSHGEWTGGRCCIRSI